MPAISQEERMRRHSNMESVRGTHAMEGMFPDSQTLVLMQKYESGEFTMEQFSAAMQAHALSLLPANALLEAVA